jgi:hypothetical protein
LEEGNWLDKFAYELGSTYERGSSRGDRSQMVSLGISRDDFYRRFGEVINEMILNSRSRYVEYAHLTALRDPTQVHPAFQLVRDEGHPKGRWIDGTPEYSLCIYGLLSLFPEARFIHIVRDVRAVVRSMVRFSANGVKLVQNQREAFDYWLRTTRACVRAEQALGPGIVHRVRYTDLVDNPTTTFKLLLEFLSEPYWEQCLEPLAKRINSSPVGDVPDGHDSSTPDSLVREAEELSDQLQHKESSQASDVEARKQLESGFWEHVRYIASLDDEVEALRRRCVHLERKLEVRARWAQNLDKEVAARDNTIRGLLDALERRTVANTLRRLGRDLYHRILGTSGSGRL